MDILEQLTGTKAGEEAQPLAEQIQVSFGCLLPDPEIRAPMMSAGLIMMKIHGKR